jgi:hypothetical protein
MPRKPKRREANMNRQYAYVIVGIVAVVVPAYVFGIFGGAEPVSAPATTPSAAGTKAS